MRATAVASGAAAAAATSILRSLETTTTTAAAAAHLEPAFRILPAVSSLVSLLNLSTRSLSTSSLVPSPTPTPSPTGENIFSNNNTTTKKKITTLPQLHSAMNVAYNSRHYDQVLSLYSSGDTQIIKPASKSDPRIAAMTYDCALKACAAAAEARQAKHILSTMWKRGVPVGRVAQGSVLKALCAAGQRAAAFQHIKGIPASRVTTMHCNTVLSACAAAHDATVGLKVWEFMKRRAVQMDYVSYCEVLRVFGAAGNIENLISLWENEIDPGLDSLHNHTAAAVLKTTQNEEEQEVEEHLFLLDEEMPLQKFNESKAMVASAYAGALAVAGQLSLAMSQCEKIMDSLAHILPQELHLAIELEAERNDEHHHQLATSKNNNNNNNSMSGGRQTAAPLDHLRSACNAVLHAAVAFHQWTYLRKMVALMTSRGLPPDVITYNALLKAAVKRGEGPQPIHEGISEMKALGLQPTCATYTLLIEAYAAEGDVEGAHTVFENSFLSNQQKINPDAAAWNAVLRAHAGIGDLVGLGQTFQLMVDQERDVIPDDSTYITCFEGIATALRKHTYYVLDHSGGGGGGGDGGPEMPPAAGAGASEIVSNSTADGKKIAMWVLHQVEQHMKKTISATKSSPAMRGALVKAHGALHHTAIVWSLLADEYIYIHSKLSQSSSISSSSSSRGPASGHVHPLPPKPSHRLTADSTSSTAVHPFSREFQINTEIEIDLLHALSTSTTAALSGTKNKNDLNFFSPRVFNAGLPCLIRAGRLDLAIQLLHHLPGSNHCPDADTYAALIGACATAASTVPSSASHHQHHHQPQLQPSFARQLLTHMQQQYALVKENELAPSTAASSSLSSPSMSTSSSTFLKPCARVYNALLRVECGRAGVNAALDLLEEMKHNEVQPNVHTWMVLRGCALGHGRPDVAEQAMYEIRILKSGGTSTTADSVIKGGEEEEAHGGVLAAATEALGGGFVEKIPQEEERHWKGYYASDEEDEW